MAGKRRYRWQAPGSRACSPSAAASEVPRPDSDGGRRRGVLTLGLPLERMALMFLAIEQLEGGEE